MTKILIIPYGFLNRGPFWSFEFLGFKFVSHFEFRYSNLINPPNSAYIDLTIPCKSGHHEHPLICQLVLPQTADGRPCRSPYPDRFLLLGRGRAAFYQVLSRRPVFLCRGTSAGWTNCQIPNFGPFPGPSDNCPRFGLAHCFDP